MPDFSRVPALLAGLLFCIPTLARADMECLSAQMLRGPVKTAVVSSGKIVAGTGAIRTLHRGERIDISSRGGPPAAGSLSDLDVTEIAYWP